MMTHLLDTSVCSQPLKRRKHEGALARWDALGPRAATSIVCLAEIEWGLTKLASARHWVSYENDILPSIVALSTDRATWSRFATMKARQHLLGCPVDDLDLLIAANAVQHGLILATLNSRHFALVEGLRWEDWSI